MTYDPFKNARQEVDRKQGRYSLGLARVTNAPDDAEHVVVISPLSDSGPDIESGPVPAEVAVEDIGEIGVPSEGDLVVFGKFSSGRLIVLASVYSDGDDVREYEAGDRHLGRDTNPFFIHASEFTLDAATIKLDQDDPVTVQAGDTTVEADSVTVESGDTTVTIDGTGVSISTTGDVSVDADTIVSDGGGKIVAAEGDTISGNGHDHGGEVSSDTVSGTIDSKSDGDIEVNQ